MSSSKSLSITLATSLALITAFDNQALASNETQDQGDEKNITSSQSVATVYNPLEAEIEKKRIERILNRLDEHLGINTKSNHEEKE